MDILKFPGNLGSVRSSVITIHHYDWPTYPIGEDFRETLVMLAAFPLGTEFVEVDNGDESILFTAKVGSRNFHICAWYEDLIEMHKRGFVNGVVPLSENSFRVKQWERMKKKVGTDKFYYKVNGELREVPAPEINEAEDGKEYFEDKNFVLLEKDSLTLTKKGLEFIINEIASIDSDYCIKISPVVSRLFKEGLYDTAVREACVTLEQAIKNEIKSKMWGERLTDNLLKSLRDEDRVLESSIRTYSQELRMVFKLVRNVFMHNIKKLIQMRLESCSFRCLE